METRVRVISQERDQALAKAVSQTAAMCLHGLTAAMSAKQGRSAETSRAGRGSTKRSKRVETPCPSSGGSSNSWSPNGNLLY